jgi:shikimate kinase
MTSAPDNSNLANRRSTSAIALVGMMGVGKTSIGRKLAEKLDLPFVDADHEIEKASGLTIAEIFERFGEAYFRDGERRVIARLIDGEAKVIATGGGAFINDETRTLMLQKATIIWLDADIDILVERVSRRQNRPLLNGKDPRETLIQLAKDRNPKYAEAHIHVRSESLPHAEMVEQLMKALSE